MLTVTTQAHGALLPGGPNKGSRAEVQSAQQEYTRRRATLVDALAQRGVEVGGTDGINIWVPVHDEAAALVRLASQGIGVTPGSPFAVLPGMPGRSHPGDLRPGGGRSPRGPGAGRPDRRSCEHHWLGRSGPRTSQSGPLTRRSIILTRPACWR